MAYTVKYSDPNKAANTINVNDLTENNTSTSLSLVGRNFSNYGVAIATNFVHLLENFSSPSSPSNAIEGQLWYNNDTNRLLVNDGTGGSTNWRPASGIHISADPTGPTNALTGDLWVNSQSQQLSLYNGQGWTLVGPSSLSGKKTGVYVEQLADSETGDLHFVSVEYTNDDVMRITATESFIPQKTIEGFSRLNPGVNLTSKKYIGLFDTTVANTPAKMYGTATSADALNVSSPSTATVIADNFARRVVTNILRGQQTIANDAGITIGTSNNFSLTVSQGTSIISNSADGGAIDVKITNAGASNLLMKFDGKNRRVGINHPTPNVELDVNGSAYISGHLIAKGTLDSTNIQTGSFQVAGGAGIAKSLYVGSNIDSKGRLIIGAVNEFGDPTTDTAILPRATDTYDIGSENNRFKNVWANKFYGTFQGVFSNSNGISAIQVSSGGLSYTSVPQVVISAPQIGSGTQATATAVVDTTQNSPTYGKVTTITITNPGSGYTTAPTVSLTGGNPVVAATIGTVTLNSATITANLAGTASGFTNPLSLSLANEVTSTAVSIQTGGTSVAVTTAINEKAITNRTEVTDNRVDDSLLVYRNNVGLRRVTRENFLLGEAFTPIGAIMAFGGVAPPLGYLLCDGSLISRQEYPTLYQVIGTVYGSGANPTYFRLPDLRGRFAMGNGSMRNSFANVTTTKQVIGAVTGNTITLNSTDGIILGSSVQASGISSTSVTVQSVPNSTQVVLTETVSLVDAVTIIFTFKVLSDTLSTSDTSRITNTGSDLGPSTLGGHGGYSHIVLDTTSGTDAATFPSGSAQAFGTTFDLNVANPYLNVNYIIRAGVATTAI
jgi:microcystin-dependent protein